MPAAMTSRQRLLAAIRHQPVDRVPIFIRGVPVCREDWVKGRHPSYKPVIDAVREKTDVTHIVGVDTGMFLGKRDVVEVTNRTEPSKREGFLEDVSVIHTPKGDLTSRHYRSTRGLPGMEAEHYVKTPADLEKFFSIPYKPFHPDTSHVQKEIDRVGESALVHVNGGTEPISLAYTLLGSELLAMWSVEERKLVRDILDEGQRRVQEHVRFLLANCSAEVIAFSGHELGLPPLLRARDFEEFVTEYERPTYAIVHEAGRLIHVHSHGKLGKFLESFVTMGIDVTHPVEGPPMGDITVAEARRRVGTKLCIEGNIQIGDVYTLPTDQIRALVRRTIDEARSAGGPGGFILCPTASPFTPELDPLVVANYLALIDTAREYGAN